jgi:hypothetical protein
MPKKRLKNAKNGIKNSKINVKNYSLYLNQFQMESTNKLRLNAQFMELEWE